jgi:hypothetical protein
MDFNKKILKIIKSTHHVVGVVWAAVSVVHAVDAAVGEGCIRGSVDAEYFALNSCTQQGL